MFQIIQQYEHVLVYNKLLLHVLNLEIEKTEDEKSEQKF
jgi:hypothetical protein